MSVKNNGKQGFVKGKSGNPNGRPKGAINKVNALAKDAIAFAGQELGGGARLVEWVKEDPTNERVFWSQIYTKLLPLQVESGEGGFVVRLEQHVGKL